MPSVVANHPVAYRSSGQQMAWLGRIGFEFVPQVTHIDAQVMALDRMRRAPDLAQQLATCQHAAGSRAKDRI